MAERRMFAKTIIDSDAFLDMPLSTQALYFHLSMRADDDGFINNPKKIQRMVGCGDDDLKLLMAKRFILVFESGVIVIKHWKIHNYIQKDRYKPTLYQDEKAQIAVKETNAYTFVENLSEPSETSTEQPSEDVYPSCIHDGYSLETQVRLGKDRLGKDRKKIKDVAPCKYSDEHLRLSQKLQNNLINDFPKEMNKVDISKWADIIRLMEKQDKLSIEAIEYVIDWLPTNEFWFGNIRSAKKLREQFEKLKFQIKSEKEKNKQPKSGYQKNIRREKLPDWVDKPQEEKELDPQQKAEIDARFEAYLAQKAQEEKENDC